MQQGEHMKKNQLIIGICVLIMGACVVGWPWMKISAESSTCCPGDGHALGNKANTESDAPKDLMRDHLECNHGHGEDEQFGENDMDHQKAPSEKHVNCGDQHVHSHDACGGGKRSDLDRTIEELWAAKCEHDILQYTCDECRYELGVVKLSDKIFSGQNQKGIVSMAMPMQRPLGKSLSLTGEVVPHDLRSIRISTVVSGTIRKVLADIGAKVSKGDILFELDSLEVAEAKADYLKKAAAYQMAARTADREASLFAKKISAEVEVIEARSRQIEAEIELASSRSRLERMGFSKNEIKALDLQTPASINGHLAVKSDIDGMVLDRFAGFGDQISAGQEVMLVSDISEVWIKADIKESDAWLLSLHNSKISCEVSVPGADGKTIPGILEAVSPKMDETTRTIRARISVINPDGLLRPGMFVHVNVTSPSSNTVLTVPDNAVLSDEGRNFVFVHKENDYWVRRPVETGVSFGGFTEIRQGLAKDQQVIVEGAFLLKSDVLREKMGAGCAD